MPLRMIRDDITRVRADAIVNTANPLPRCGSGTDAAIYKAAGAEKLLAERKKIGVISPGEAAVTAAFSLPAKYIIHTVGPSWTDGKHGEFDILRSCYRKSLLLAEQLGCESIAFPLIATGVYGFPKDQALDIALEVIREHLQDSDLEVILVVFGRSSFQIAAGLVEQVEEYIDEHYVAEKTAEEYESCADRRQEYGRRRREYEAFYGKMPLSPGSASLPDVRIESLKEKEKDLPRWKMPKSAAFPSQIQKEESLEDLVNNLGESFQQKLFRMIDERGMTDPEVYNRANVDRKLFSKIRCSEDYIPKKRTIVALAIGMKLNLDDTKDLLASAGLTLTNNSKADLIVKFCIENGIYDVYRVNSLLLDFDQPDLR